MPIPSNNRMEQVYEIAKGIHDDWEEKLDSVTSQEEMKKYNAQRLDGIRLSLEPHVYHYLIEQYSPMLNSFWSTYRPPKVAKYAFVLVERRIHPNYWFILRNMAWAGPNMSVYLFCSDKNVDYIKSLLGDKAPYFNIMQVFKGNPSRERGKKEVDNLLSDYRTYQSIQAEYCLTMEMDTFLRRKVPVSMFEGTYWGCVWAWAPTRPGGGGLTVRNIQHCIELCKKHRNLTKDLPVAQDCWLSDVSEQIPGVPTVNFRIELLMEAYPVLNPVGVHQFWTFIDNFQIKNKAVFMKYLTSILTFENS